MDKKTKSEKAKNLEPLSVKYWRYADGSSVAIITSPTAKNLRTF